MKFVCGSFCQNLISTLTISESVSVECKSLRSDVAACCWLLAAPGWAAERACNVTNYAMKYSRKLPKTDDWSHNPAIKSGHHRDFGQDKEKRRWVWIGYRRSLPMLCQGPGPTFKRLTTQPSGGLPHQYICSSQPHSSVGETNQNIQEEYFNLAYYLHFTFYFQMQTVYHLYHPHATIAATIQIPIWSTYLHNIHLLPALNTPRAETIRAPLW